MFEALLPQMYVYTFYMQKPHYRSCSPKIFQRNCKKQHKKVLSTHSTCTFTVGRYEKLSCSEVSSSERLHHHHHHYFIIILTHHRSRMAGMAWIPLFIYLIICITEIFSPQVPPPAGFCLHRRGMYTYTNN